MLKIKDLGIGLVPAAKRAAETPYEYWLDGTTAICNTGTCCSAKKPAKKKSSKKTSKKAPAKKPSKKGYRSSGFDDVAVALLQRQLEEQLRKQS